MVTDFNGFDKGVIGKKLPSDTTLNNMRKDDLIELLHIADHNHNVLAQAYKIAVDNSKCNVCPLGRDTEKILIEFADYISNYFDNPSLYGNPDKLIEMFYEHKNIKAGGKNGK